MIMFLQVTTVQKRCVLKTKDESYFFLVAMLPYTKMCFILSIFILSLVLDFLFQMTHEWKEEIEVWEEERKVKSWEKEGYLVN